MGECVAETLEGENQKTSQCSGEGLVEQRLLQNLQRLQLPGVEAGEALGGGFAHGFDQSALDSFQGWQRYRGNHQSDTPRLPGHSADESTPFEREHHRMHAGSSDLKIPLHVCLRWGATVDQVILKNVGEELALPLSGIRGFPYSLQRGANCREDDVIRSDALPRSARRVLSFEALSFLNFKGRVGNAGNVDVVELRFRRLERVNRLGLFENFAQPLCLPPLLHSSALMLPSTSALSAFHGFHFPFVPSGSRGVRSSAVSSFICWMAI
jgi:hypothetical protein